MAISISMTAYSPSLNIPQSIDGYTYQVFLSFRGEDTRKNFTDHLYNALMWAGIQTFRDDDAIERGGDINIEIEKAIRGSKMSLIVFSRDFASSTWCLDEVVMIMEHRKATGHIVLPIFYDVDPSDVGQQTGNFAKAFSIHEEDFKDDTDKVEGWRSALRKVTDLAGEVLRDRYEAQFIQNIVKEVAKRLNRTMLNVPSYLVGIDTRTNAINLWLQDESENARIAVIYGIPGVGKTTIAKIVFNLNFQKFDSWSFLKDVRETSKQSYGVEKLQRQLLSDILKGKTNEIYNEGDIECALWNKKVIIVLDDVDDVDQLHSIIGSLDRLYHGSKVIITTRHERLLSPHEAGEKFRVMALDENESLQLLSWHAFRREHPDEVHIEYSKTMVNYCGGVPLALTVLGSSLSGRENKFWERATQEPEEVDGGRIHNILKISYESILDDRDKNLFLDVACFFIGEDLNFVDRLLQSCDFYRKVGLQELIDRHLIAIDKENKLATHQLLRDLGREIVRQQSPENLGHRSRIWRHVDAFQVLRKNMGTSSIKSLILDLEQVSTVSKDLVDLKTSAFAHMSNLKMLHLNNVRFSGDYSHIPKGLLWLCWHGFPLSSVPNKLFLEDLIVLDLSNSSLKYAWNGIQIFPELKILNLSHCQCLIRSPDISGLPSLEMLILEGCINLVEVDKSIGYLKNLVFVNLEDCRNLRTLPKEMSMLKSRLTLILSGCSKLDEIPSQLERLQNLFSVISVDRNVITRLQNWFSNMLSGSREGALSTSFSLASLPCSLVKLSLADCNLRDMVLLDDHSSLPSLEYLDLTGNLMHTLPESFNSRTTLKSLVLQRCTMLQSLPDLPKSIGRLLISNFPVLLAPLDIYFLGRQEPDELRGLFQLQQIENFDIEMIYNLDLLKSESAGSTQVCQSGIQTLARGQTSIKVYFEQGIISTFYPVTEIPDWFCLLNLTGMSQACFYVPESPGPEICSFSLLVVYACDNKNVGFDIPSHAKIRIHFKGRGWEYRPTIFGVPESNEDMLWLSSWRHGRWLGAGDIVACSVDVPPGFRVKKLGIHLVYMKQNPVKQQGCKPGHVYRAENAFEFVHEFFLPPVFFPPRSRWN